MLFPIKHLFAGCLIFVLSFLSYSNSLHSAFMLDDRGYFNSTMKHLKFIPYHFLPGKGSILGLEKKNNLGYYRPMTRSLYTVLYVAFGENPFWYHIVNILFLALSAFLLYALVMMYFNPQAALWAGILYALHPFNATMVNFIGTGAYQLQTAFMLASLLLIQRSLVSSVFLFAASMFFHESAVALVVYAACFVVILKRPLFKSIGPLVLAAGGYLIFRLIFTSLKGHLTADPAWAPDFFSKLCSMAQVFLWFLSQLLKPDGISFVWGVIYHSHVAWLLGLISVISLMIFGILQSLKRQRAIFALGLSWIICSIFPLWVGGGTRPGMFCIEPHWMTFALIGYCLCVAQLIAMLRNKFQVFVIILFSCLLIILTRQYNELWKKEEVYCHFWMNQIPFFKTPYHFMAEAYEARGDLSMAQYHYGKAFENDGNRTFNYNMTMGMIALKQQQWAKAKEHLEIVLRINPDSPSILSHLGVIAFAQNNIPLAKQYFRQAIKEERFEIISRLNLSSIARQEGDFQESVRLNQEVLSLEPRNETAMVELIQSYMALGDQKGIITSAKLLLKTTKNPLYISNANALIRQYEKP